MRSTLMVVAASLLSLLGLTWLGLDVADEAMLRAPSQTAIGADIEVGVIGPSPLVGPRAPGVPKLRLAAAEVGSSEPTAAGPNRLRIDSVGVDSSIVAVGVDGAGAFDLPGPDVVGWYEHGPVPGGAGSAVLAAHVDLGHRRAVFFALDTVEQGDRIDVGFTDGSSRSFEVVDNVLYDKTALPNDTLFGRQGDAVLHLVTCGGRYDASARHYLGNRVVSAVPLD